MMGFFQRAKPERPATVPTDTIIPSFALMTILSTYLCILYITLRFDNVLDSERLRQSLQRLMELSDWRKLGARMRKTVIPSHQVQNSSSKLSNPYHRILVNSSTMSLLHSTQRDQDSHTRIKHPLASRYLDQPTICIYGPQHSR
jgi:hypothetical protein